jgi:peptide deformylase
MAILPIIEAPHPILSQIAREVREDEFVPELVTLLNNMAITMYAAPGVGLAAPQVGDSRRILVADPGNDDDAIPRKLYQMVNPIVLEHSKEKINYDESCLSVPEYSQMINRYKRIRVSWRAPDGSHHDEWFEEFSAIVLQHEMDHLEGITLLEHSNRIKRSRYLKRKKQRKRTI